MSNNHSTPIEPAHPLLSGPLAENPHHLEEALGNCAATLYMLADFFGSNADNYSVLDTDAARRGMWLQLYGVAGVLECVEAHLQRARIGECSHDNAC